MADTGRSTNASGANSGGEQIVPIGQDATRPRPQSIISAVSTIQHYYLMESDGENIPSEFLTIEGVWDYFSLGFRSGFYEGVFLFLFFPFIEFYLIPFVLTKPSPLLTFLLTIISYSLVIFNTALCFYIARYYIGNITRKAINALFMGRMMGLLCKATVIWLLWYTVYGLSQFDKYTWWVCDKLGTIGLNSQLLYYNFYRVRPHIMPATNKAAILLVIAAVGPYGVSWFYDWYKQWREDKINRILES